MKISIITAVYNNREFIEDCIKSVIAQDYPDIEHIVVDGASSDGTLEVIKKHEDHISRWISEPDRGIYDAMNKGLALASGDVIGFLNGDDIFFDNQVVSRIAAEFTPRVDCIFGNLVYVSRENIDKVTRRWVSEDFKEGLFEKSWTPAHPTFYCRKQFYEKYGTYRLDFIISSDTELMFRFLQKHKLRSRFADFYFVKMRDSGVSNRGIKSTLIIIREMKKAITDNGGRFNFFKYVFYKFLKIKQIMFRNKE